ncbi:response regulator [Noviherbaspirillum aerium]|uniref:hypothetical protein n=1 Tax=Noviherbaspirillum aerium TaxID=2588497 RepID=UPI00124BEFDB|nr:hypothetical protein [Noviherbaspirillum aerium]
MKDKSKPKLLLAIRPKAVPRLTKALSAEFSLAVCHTIEEALAALDEEIDAVICGTNFDESRMFELLRRIKRDHATRHVPFVCVKAFGGVLHEGSDAGVAKAAELLDACAYIDFARWRVEFGKNAAAEKLRTALHDIASMAKPDPDA